MIHLRISAIWATFFAGLTMIALPPSPDAASNNSSTIIVLRQAGERFFVQPNGPFAVMLFPEDALGDHIGIIYYKNMEIPIDGAWKITDRFWQTEEWGSDVRAFAWGPSGRTLYLSTWPVYGTGFLYRIDLFARRATRIFPPDKIKSGADYYLNIELVKADAQTKKMKIKFQKAESSPEEFAELPFD